MEGWWKSAFVGQEVVCVNTVRSIIDERPLYLRWPFPRPCVLVVGNVYTISSIEADSDMTGGVGITLTALPEDELYSVGMFRPVKTKSTDKTVKEIIRKSLETPADLELV